MRNKLELAQNSEVHCLFILNIIVLLYKNEIINCEFKIMK